MQRIATPKGLLTAAVAAALAFGAAQALAAPAEAKAPPNCKPGQCQNNCIALGYSGGVCMSDGSCFCYFDR
ncbi:MAG TPA: hypothetical protein VF746_03765 [Longimicrobium sp.]|jgi:Spy/CpxP family protein refolding chaperone